MHRAVLPAFLALLAAQVCTPVWALYKVVGPDGRVTYTDRPPSDRPAQTLRANGATASTEGLPYELQRVVARYPVTLYTGAKCAPCDAARQLLKERGVPFVEKTISTSDDAKAYSKQEGTDQLPTARIGQKQLLGYNQVEWASYIDAAGYPAKSALPLNYRWPEPTPLAPPEPKSGASAPADTGRAPVAPANNGDTPPPGAAPSGFRF